MSLGLLWVSLLAGKESLDCEPWGWDPAGYWYIAGTLDIQWMTFKENSKLSKHSLGGSVTGNLPSGFEKIYLYGHTSLYCASQTLRIFANWRQDQQKNYDLLYCHVVWNQTRYISETSLYQENQQVIGVVRVNIPQEVMFCLFLPLFSSFRELLLISIFCPPPTLQYESNVF